MKIAILHTGKTTHSYVKEGVQVFLNRLQKYASVEEIELPTAKIKYPNQAELQKLKEGEVQLKYIKADDFVILLDENGKEYHSRGFATFLENQFQTGTKRIVFLSGGAYGFSEPIYQRANHTFALSKMTFSHQLIRVIFAEQLYRAFSIIHNEPYHND